MDLHRLRVVGFDTTTISEKDGKENITDVEEFKQEEQRTVTPEHEQDETNELEVNKQCSVDNLTPPGSSFTRKSKSEIFRVPSKSDLKKKGLKNNSSLEDITQPGRISSRSSQRKRLLKIFNRKSTIRKLTEIEETKKQRVGRSKNSEIKILFTRDAPNFIRHSRKRTKNYGSKRSHESRSRHDVFGFNKNRFIDPYQYQLSCHYLNIDKFPFKKLRKGFHRKQKVDKVTGPQPTKETHCKHHAMRILDSGIRSSLENTKSPSIYYNLSTHSHPHRKIRRQDILNQDEGWKKIDESVAVTSASLLPIKKCRCDACVGPSKVQVNACKIHLPDINQDEPSTIDKPCLHHEKPQNTPSTNCTGNKSRQGTCNNCKKKRSGGAVTNCRRRVLSGFLQNITALHTRNQSTGKNCVKYAFIGLLIIVWSPCLLAVVLAWIIMCPIRLTNALAKDRSKKPLSFVNSFMKKFCKKCPGSEYQRMCCNHCSHQKNKNLMSSVASWYARTANTFVNSFNTVLSTLKIRNNTSRCCGSSFLTSHPNPRKRYTLFYANNRGWMMKPVRHANTRSSGSTRVLQSMRCEVKPRLWEKSKHKAQMHNVTNDSEMQFHVSGIPGRQAHQNSPAGDASSMLPNDAKCCTCSGNRFWSSARKRKPGSAMFTPVEPQFQQVNIPQKNVCPLLQFRYNLAQYQNLKSKLNVMRLPGSAMYAPVEPQHQQKNIPPNIANLISELKSKIAQYKTMNNSNAINYMEMAGVPQKQMSTYYQGKFKYGIQPFGMVFDCPCGKKHPKIVNNEAFKCHKLDLTGKKINGSRKYTHSYNVKSSQRQSLNKNGTVSNYSKRDASKSDKKLVIPHNHKDIAIYKNKEIKELNRAHRKKTNLSEGQSVVKSVALNCPCKPKRALNTSDKKPIGTHKTIVSKHKSHRRNAIESEAVRTRNRRISTDLSQSTLTKHEGTSTFKIDYENKSQSISKHNLKKKVIDLANKSHTLSKRVLSQTVLNLADNTQSFSQQKINGKNSSQVSSVTIKSKDKITLKPKQIATQFVSQKSSPLTIPTKHQQIETIRTAFDSHATSFHSSEGTNITKNLFKKLHPNNLTYLANEEKVVLCKSRELLLKREGSSYRSHQTPKIEKMAQFTWPATSDTSYSQIQTLLYKGREDCCCCCKQKNILNTPLIKQVDCRCDPEKVKSTLDVSEMYKKQVDLGTGPEKEVIPTKISDTYKEKIECGCGPENEQRILNQVEKYNERTDRGTEPDKEPSVIELPKTYKEQVECGCGPDKVESTHKTLATYKEQIDQGTEPEKEMSALKLPDTYKGQVECGCGPEKEVSTSVMPETYKGTVDSGTGPDKEVIPSGKPYTYTRQVDSGCGPDKEVSPSKIETCKEQVECACGPEKKMGKSKKSVPYKGPVECACGPEIKVSKSKKPESYKGPVECGCGSEKEVKKSKKPEIYKGPVECGCGPEKEVSKSKKPESLKGPEKEVSPKKKPEAKELVECACGSEVSTPKKSIWRKGKPKTTGKERKAKTTDTEYSCPCLKTSPPCPSSSCFVKPTEKATSTTSTTKQIEQENITTQSKTNKKIKIVKKEIVECECGPPTMLDKSIQKQPLLSDIGTTSSKPSLVTHSAQLKIECECKDTAMPFEIVDKKDMPKRQTSKEQSSSTSDWISKITKGLKLSDKGTTVSPKKSLIECGCGPEEQLSLFDRILQRPGKQLKFLQKKSSPQQSTTSSTTRIDEALNCPCEDEPTQQPDKLLTFVSTKSSPINPQQSTISITTGITKQKSDSFSKDSITTTNSFSTPISLFTQNSELEYPVNKQKPRKGFKLFGISTECPCGKNEVQPSQDKPSTQKIEHPPNKTTLEHRSSNQKQQKGNKLFGILSGSNQKIPTKKSGSKQPSKQKLKNEKKLKEETTECACSSDLQKTSELDQKPGSKQRLKKKPKKGSKLYSKSSDSDKVSKQRSKSKEPLKKKPKKGSKLFGKSSNSDDQKTSSGKDSTQKIESKKPLKKKPKKVSTLFVKSSGSDQQKPTPDKFSTKKSGTKQKPQKKSNTLGIASDCACDGLQNMVQDKSSTEKSKPQQNLNYLKSRKESKLLGIESSENKADKKKSILSKTAYSDKISSAGPSNRKIEVPKLKPSTAEKPKQSAIVGIAPDCDCASIDPIRGNKSSQYIPPTYGIQNQASDITSASKQRSFIKKKSVSKYAPRQPIAEKKSQIFGIASDCPCDTNLQVTTYTQYVPRPLCIRFGVASDRASQYIPCTVSPDTHTTPCGPPKITPPATDCGCQAYLGTNEVVENIHSSHPSYTSIATKETTNTTQTDSEMEEVKSTQTIYRQIKTSSKKSQTRRPRAIRKCTIRKAEPKTRTCKTCTEKASSTDKVKVPRKVKCRVLNHPAHCRCRYTECYGTRLKRAIDCTCRTKLELSRRREYDPPRSICTGSSHKKICKCPSKISRKTSPHQLQYNLSTSAFRKCTPRNIEPRTRTCKTCTKKVDSIQKVKATRKVKCQVLNRPAHCRCRDTECYGTSQERAIDCTCRTKRQMRRRREYDPPRSVCTGPSYKDICKCKPKFIHKTSPRQQNYNLNTISHTDSKRNLPQFKFLKRKDMIASQKEYSNFVKPLKNNNDLKSKPDHDCSCVTKISNPLSFRSRKSVSVNNSRPYLSWRVTPLLRCQSPQISAFHSSCSCVLEKLKNASAKAFGHSRQVMLLDKSQSRIKNKHVKVLKSIECDCTHSDLKIIKQDKINNLQKQLPCQDVKQTLKTNECDCSFNQTTSSQRPPSKSRQPSIISRIMSKLFGHKTSKKSKIPEDVSINATEFSLHGLDPWSSYLANNNISQRVTTSVEAFSGNKSQLSDLRSNIRSLSKKSQDQYILPYTPHTQCHCPIDKTLPSQMVDNKKSVSSLKSIMVDKSQSAFSHGSQLTKTSYRMFLPIYANYSQSCSFHTRSKSHSSDYLSRRSSNRQLSTIYYPKESNKTSSLQLPSKKSSYLTSKYKRNNNPRLSGRNLSEQSSIAMKLTYIKCKCLNEKSSDSKKGTEKKDKKIKEGSSKEISKKDSQEKESTIKGKQKKVKPKKEKPKKEKQKKEKPKKEKPKKDKPKKEKTKKERPKKGNSKNKSPGKEKTSKLSSLFRRSKQIESKTKKETSSELTLNGDQSKTTSSSKTSSDSELKSSEQLTPSTEREGFQSKSGTRPPKKTTKGTEAQPELLERLLSQQRKVSKNSRQSNSQQKVSTHSQRLQSDSKSPNATTASDAQPMEQVSSQPRQISKHSRQLSSRPTLSTHKKQLQSEPMIQKSRNMSKNYTQPESLEGIPRQRREVSKHSRQSSSRPTPSSDKSQLKSEPTLQLSRKLTTKSKVQPKLLEQIPSQRDETFKSSETFSSVPTPTKEKQFQSGLLTESIKTPTIIPGKCSCNTTKSNGLSDKVQRHSKKSLTPLSTPSDKVPSKTTTSTDVPLEQREASKLISQPTPSTPKRVKSKSFKITTGTDAQPELFSKRLPQQGETSEHTRKLTSQLTPTTERRHQPSIISQQPRKMTTGTDARPEPFEKITPQQREISKHSRTQPVPSTERQLQFEPPKLSTGTDTQPKPLDNTLAQRREMSKHSRKSTSQLTPSTNTQYPSSAISQQPRKMTIGTDAQPELLEKDTPQQQRELSTKFTPSTERRLQSEPRTITNGTAQPEFAEKNKSQQRETSKQSRKLSSQLTPSSERRPQASSVSRQSRKMSKHSRELRTEVTSSTERRLQSEPRTITTGTAAQPEFAEKNKSQQRETSKQSRKLSSQLTPSSERRPQSSSISRQSRKMSKQSRELSTEVTPSTERRFPSESRKITTGTDAQPKFLGTPSVQHREMSKHSRKLTLQLTPSTDRPHQPSMISKHSNKKTTGTDAQPELLQQRERSKQLPKLSSQPSTERRLEQGSVSQHPHKMTTGTDAQPEPVGKVPQKQREMSKQLRDISTQRTASTETRKERLSRKMSIGTGAQPEVLGSVPRQRPEMSEDSPQPTPSAGKQGFQSDSVSPLETKRQSETPKATTEELWDQSDIKPQQSTPVEPRYLSQRYIRRQQKISRPQLPVEPFIPIPIIPGTCTCAQQKPQLQLLKLEHSSAYMHSEIREQTELSEYFPNNFSSQFPPSANRQRQFDLMSRQPLPISSEIQGQLEIEHFIHSPIDTINQSSIFRGSQPTLTQPQKVIKKGKCVCLEKERHRDQQRDQKSESTHPSQTVKCMCPSDEKEKDAEVQTEVSPKKVKCICLEKEQEERMRKIEQNKFQQTDDVRSDAEPKPVTKLKYSTKTQTLPLFRRKHPLSVYHMTYQTRQPTLKTDQQREVSDLSHQSTQQRQATKQKRFLGKEKRFISNAGSQFPHKKTKGISAHEDFSNKLMRYSGHESVISRLNTTSISNIKSDSVRNVFPQKTQSIASQRNDLKQLYPVKKTSPLKNVFSPDNLMKFIHSNKFTDCGCDDKSKTKKVNPKEKPKKKATEKLKQKPKEKPKKQPKITHIDKKPPGLQQQNSPGQVRQIRQMRTASPDIAVGPQQPYPDFNRVTMRYPENTASPNNIKQMPTAQPPKRAQHIPFPSNYYYQPPAQAALSPPNYARFPCFTNPANRCGPRRCYDETALRSAYKRRPLVVPAPPKTKKELKKEEKEKKKEKKNMEKENKALNKALKKKKKEEQKKKKKENESLYACLKDVVDEAEKDAWPTKVTCNPIYIHTLKHKPCFWIYECYPSIYPAFLSFYKCQKNLCQLFVYCFAICFWCPCIAFVYLCCDVMCRNG